MQIDSKKLKIRKKAITFFAENKETTIEELANHLKKDYTTALRLLNELLNLNLVKMSREQTTSVRGKKKKIYIITILGLKVYLTYREERDIKKIVKVHSDRVLIFQKWDSFIQNECEEIILNNIDRTASDSFKIVQLEMILLPPYYRCSDEELIYQFNCDALGFMRFLCSQDFLKNSSKEWVNQIKLWKFVEEDIELKKLKERFLMERQIDFEHQIKNINFWKNYFRGDKEKEC